MISHIFAHTQQQWSSTRHSTVLTSHRPDHCIFSNIAISLFANVPSFSAKGKISVHCEEIDNDVHLGHTLKRVKATEFLVPELTHIFFQGKLKVCQHSQALILSLQIAVPAALKLAFAAQHSKHKITTKKACGQNFSVGQRNLIQFYMRPVR